MRTCILAHRSRWESFSVPVVYLEIVIASLRVSKGYSSMLMPWMVKKVQSIWTITSWEAILQLCSTWWGVHQAIWTRISPRLRLTISGVGMSSRQPRITCRRRIRVGQQRHPCLALLTTWTPPTPMSMRIRQTSRMLIWATRAYSWMVAWVSIILRILLWCNLVTVSIILFILFCIESYWIH